MRRFTELRNAVGLGLAAGLAITCVVLLTIPNDVELVYKKMTEREAYQARVVTVTGRKAAAAPWSQRSTAREIEALEPRGECFEW